LIKRYRFCGKERDEESGLYYYGARYYAPWCCRFVSVDPLAGDYPYYTPYQYAGNQPIISIDIDGLEGSVQNNPQNENRPIQDTRSNEGYRRPDDFRQHPGNIGDVPGSVENDDQTHIEPEKHVDNVSFAIYVAFSDQTAAVGKNDKSAKAKLVRAAYGNQQLPVEHAGIIIGDGDSGKTYYFDFGRFNASLYAQKEGKGITRSSIEMPILSTIDATFDQEGNVANSVEIVSSLVHGSDSYFDNGNYGTVEYGVYPNLNFEKMYEFTTGHGSRVFGIEGDNTFCAKFANQTIVAGGGKMPDIEKELDKLTPELLKMKIQGKSQKEIAKRGPVPSNMAEMIRKKYSQINKGYKKLKC
jgi:RHS repeat-associated protein